jgi:hypothetical protein
MSINATTSSTSQVSSTQSTAQTSSASNSDSAKKTSSESSFKDEMNKVDSSEKSKESKDTSEANNQNKKVEDSTKDKNSDNLDDLSQSNNQNQNLLEGGVDYSNFASMSMLNANNNLTDNIQQMFNLNTAATSEISSKSNNFFGFDDSNSISMTESDANFFINLTQNNDISMQNVTAQAQNLLNNGAEVSNVKQNVQVSQALLDALSNARETNQPLRIDFDQNVSVILRIGKDGSFAANFIPGDKAVEQYLKTNIDSLKATFRENDLPYSDLSYSSRGKQQQKENRRNKQ